MKPQRIILIMLLSLGLGACGSLRTHLSVLDAAGAKVDGTGNNAASKIVKVTPGKPYQVLAEANGQAYVKEVTIKVPPERVASGSIRTTRSPALSGVLFARAVLKPIGYGEYLTISAEGRNVNNVTANSGDLILVAGIVVPVLTDLKATPARLELGGTVTLTWKVEHAAKQELSVTGTPGAKPLAGSVQTATFKTTQIGTQTATLKTTSITGQIATLAVKVDVIPPIRCELKRPQDQILEIKGLAGNRRHDGPRLVGNYSNRVRTMYGEAVTTADKAQAVVHQIRAVISANRSISREDHSLVIFDLRQCSTYQNVAIGSGLSVGKLHLASSSGRNWAMFTMISWSGSSISNYHQTVTAVIQELSTKQANRRQRHIQLSGIPYNNKTTSIFFNGTKDRAVILAMGKPTRTESVTPYQVYSIDFTKLGRFRQAGEIGPVCAFGPRCIKINPPTAVTKGSANYARLPTEAQPPGPFQYNPNIPRYHYDFSAAITRFQISGDVLTVQGRGELIRGTNLHNGRVKLK